VHLSRVAADLRHLLLPRVCLGCGAVGRWWCPRCEAAAATSAGWIAAGELPVMCTGSYDQLGPLVRAFKDGGVTGVRGVLVARLAAAVTATDVGAAALVRVPPSRGSLIRRGRDPMAEVAAGVSGALAMPLVDALRWRGRHRTQKGLARGDRLANMAGAIEAVPGALAPGSAAIVLDDVITTGATMSAAAAALVAAGIRVPAGAVVCAAPVGPNAPARRP
jgi:predicted amidophosphoribosyltransferase